MSLNIPIATAGKLLADVGTPAFGDALMQATRELLCADFCSIFAFHEGAGPTCLASSGVKSKRLALMAADRYLTDHWHHEQMVADFPRRRRRDSLLYVGLGDVTGGGHLNECFVPLKIVDRITFVYGDSSQFLRFSIYRTNARPPFSNQELKYAREAEALIEPAIHRHYTLLTHSGADAMRGVPNEQLMRRRLKAMNHKLSSREIEVCAAILQGMTAEGISLRLGVAKTSVATYRQRAYAKLGIATQNELFASILGN